MAQFARYLRGPRISADQKFSTVQRGLARGKQHVRPKIASDEINVILLDQLVSLLFAYRRLEAIGSSIVIEIAKTLIKAGLRT